MHAIAFCLWASMVFLIQRWERQPFFIIFRVDYFDFYLSVSLANDHSLMSDRKKEKKHLSINICIILFIRACNCFLFMRAYDLSHQEMRAKTIFITSESNIYVFLPFSMPDGKRETKAHLIHACDCYRSACPMVSCIKR